MRVIPVIDLKDGLVVRGVAGRRDQYRPIQSRLAPDPRPATIARAFVEQFGFDTVYAADLDAITRNRPDAAAWTAIAREGLALLLDAGLSNLESARVLLKMLEASGIEASLIAGLESLEAERVLPELVALVQPERLIFSLDMQAGRLLTRIAAWQQLTAAAIAGAAVDAGVQRMIVLDLADVGTAGGTQTLELCRALRAAHPKLELIAGGGVRGITDLRALAAAGCDAALVASALHDGRLTREEIAQL